MAKKKSISKSEMFSMQRQRKGLVFRRSKEGRLKISEESLSIFKSFIQDDFKKKEAGGVLLGRMINNTEDIVIDLVSQPQKKDKRKRTFFRRSDDHQAIINEAWDRSDGTCNYLGEWHTHPEDSPTPSGIDLKNWLIQLRKAEYEGDILFFIIVGIQEMVVYEANQKDHNIKKLKWQRNQKKATQESQLRK